MVVNVLKLDSSWKSRLKYKGKTIEEQIQNNQPAIALLQKWLIQETSEEMPHKLVHLSIIPQVYQRLNMTPEQIAIFCQKWQIIEFALFGSILRDDFRVAGEKPSDIDILFTYSQDAPKNLIVQIRMKYELEDLCHRSVDFVSKTALSNDPNYIRRQNILASAQVIYESR